ncbi:hypothetical protein EYC80_002262 [Monilinia laxa]|uniref:AB hydrolase-1 domain-containing protein n=1 Tax=Monilinia laxa TaxID=61186 RepID=A0A5N6K3G3_MONLA|nr:hypothetical protein EYC80_002262 [Monilinia laxa]
MNQTAPSFIFFQATRRLSYNQNPIANIAPTTLLVPGFWEGPTVFEQVMLRVQEFEIGIKTKVAALPSTGTSSPENPNMNDGIAAFHSIVQALMNDEKDVLMVLHSSGGFIGASAIEGLIVKARTEKALKGGVAKLVLLAAAIFPEGSSYGLFTILNHRWSGGWHHLLCHPAEASLQRPK